MSKLRKYRVIEQKLEQMPGPDVESLWTDMRSRLDHHMPEEQEKRRMLWWWKNSGIFLIVPFAIFVSSIFFTISIIDNSNDQSPDEAAPTGTTGGVTISDEVSGITFRDPEDVTAADSDNKPELPVASRKGGAATASGRNTVSLPTAVKKANNTKQTSQATITGSQTALQSRTAVKQGVIATAVAADANTSGPDASIQAATSAAVINIGAIMRKGLNTGVPTMHQQLVLLPAPKPGTTGLLFLNQAVQQQAAASNSSPVLPAATTAGATKQAGYRSLNLSTSLHVSPFVLQRTDLVAPNSMSFPADAVTRSRFGFVPKFVAGAAVQMNLPVSSQEMSTVSINGGNNKLFDYMPSVYVQYHFARKLFVQSEFQFITPQHTPKLTLSNTTTEIGPYKKQVHSVQLTKFYYMNLPVSLHYRVLPNLYAGAGIQYSYMTRSMLTEQEAIWQKGTNGWEQKTATVKLHVKKNPEKEKEKFKTQNNPNPGVPPLVPTPVDVVAQQFKSNDLRFTYDLNYYRRRFNAGIRMNIGINNYIDTKVSGTNVPVRDRNKSLQLYIRYNLLERKRR